jgi:hypothetical protein
MKRRRFFVMLAALLCIVALAGPASASNNHSSGRISATRGCYFTAHHHWANGRVYANTTVDGVSAAFMTCQTLKVTLQVIIGGVPRTITDYGYPRNTVPDASAFVIANGTFVSSRHCAKAFGAAAYICYNMS